MLLSTAAPALALAVGIGDLADHLFTTVLVASQVAHELERFGIAAPLLQELWAIAGATRL